MKRILFSLLCAFFYLASGAQCMIREIPLQHRAISSDLIVEGKVTATYSYWNTGHNMIYTSNIIEVYKVFRGTGTPSQIEIITEGGIVGSSGIKVNPELELNVGDVGVFTCIAVTRAKGLPQSLSSIPRFEAYASVQGFVKYNVETQTASDPFRTYQDIENEIYNVVLSPSFENYKTVNEPGFHSIEGNGNEQMGGPSISGFSPGSLRGGTGDVLTINGTGFGTSQGSGTVGFKNADNGGSTYFSPLASQYLSWSDTQIMVQVPEDAGTGTIQVSQGSTVTSTSTLTVTYTHLNSISGGVARQTDHIDDNGSGGYTWQMNTAFDANTAARASFMRAFDTWRCGTGIEWVIGSTTSTDVAVNDGINIICFDNANPLPAGAAGRCSMYFGLCGSGPTLTIYVNELDILFDEGSGFSPLTWQFGPAQPTGSQIDFETVAVHELGHGHQLGHVINNGAIMHYTITTGTSNRTLGVNDQAGGDFVQAKSEVANPCGPGPMSHHICPIPPVASFTSSQNTICAGATANFTDNSTGGPTSWTWTFPGGSPGSATTQNVSNVMWSTAGTYTVSLTISNANGSSTYTQTITVNALPVVAASSNNTTICTGNSTTLVATGASSYSWTPGILTGSSVTVSPTATTTYTVTGTSSNGCTNTATINIVVVAPPATPTITVAGNVLTSSVSGISYQWYLNGSPITGATGQSHTAIQSGSYTVEVFNAGCGSGQSAPVMVTSPAPVAAFTTSSSTICAGATANFTDNSTGGPTSWTWTFPGGSPGSATTQNVSNVMWSAAGTYTVSLTVSNVNGSSTYTQTITVNALPAVAASSNNTTICTGNSTTLVATGASSYSWTPGNLPGSSVTVSPTATTTYTVTGTNSNGCTNTATINIVVVAPPATPTITVAGNVLTSSVSGISYQWYLNGSPITGATGQSHTAIQTGSYTVEVFNAGCGSGQSAPVMITSLAPVAAFTTSSSTICAGATANFTDNSTGGPTSWTWTFPGGSPGSATTQNVSNVMWSAAGTYTVSLTVSNANGSSTYTQTITVNTAPATPTIFQIGNVLVSSVSGASYQWYLNGNPIPGATAQSYTPTQSGNYSVVVFDSAGCASAQSAPLMVIGIDSPGNSVSFISVFPNPANGSFQLTFTAANDNYMLEIHDMLGQIVYSEALPGFSGTYNKTFDLAAYGHGVYIIRLRSNENETNVRVISY